MQLKNQWFLIPVVTAFLMLITVHDAITATPPFKKVALATKSPPSTSTTTTTTTTVSSIDDSSNTENDDKYDNNTSTGHVKNSKLTGIPQIDYIWDPNLPRELRGYNLSSYPFFASVPPEEDIHFKCDGLHDGFYASIEHKCQLYHHCVYGIRHDFLCANFTAFDQKTFICHFVSDVDCEGSQKYWNRNDNLYMATTTTTTTTTTTEPPPTQKRRLIRPSRPLRRPINRRPVDDYYYDELEYDDDYYEERLNRRRKQRPRRRKPILDYDDDEYEDERRLLNNKSRRTNSRDRFRDDIDIEPEDDYSIDNSKLDRTKSHGKHTGAVERHKINAYKTITSLNRSSLEERKISSEERPMHTLSAGRRRPPIQSPTLDETHNLPPEATSRRVILRKRINEKRPNLMPATPSALVVDELDDYERTNDQAPEQEEVVGDEEVPLSMSRKSVKPLEEFITPKASPSSVYSKPRAPPRIARPVPINEKKKFQYPIQKTATKIPPTAAVMDEDPYYYEEEDYVNLRNQRVNSRRHQKEDIENDEELTNPIPRRRNQKPLRPLRKSNSDKKSEQIEYDDYDFNDRYEARRDNRKKYAYSTRLRQRGGATSNDDVDFIDYDYDERHLRRSKINGNGGRRVIKKPRIPEVLDEDMQEEFERGAVQNPLRNQPLSNTGRRKNLSSPTGRVRLQSNHQQQLSTSNSNSEPEQTYIDERVTLSTSKSQEQSSNRPASVRVVKRPFLPSRGGSPYLTRGLQPVGLKSFDSHTTEKQANVLSINTGSTISGVHFLEYGVPLLRETGARTTLPPRSPLPVAQPHPNTQTASKATLDELYETDYDVTLNDALNPTLKSLSPHQSTHLLHHHNHQTYQMHNQPENSHSNRRFSNVYSSLAPFIHDNHPQGFVPSHSQQSQSSISSPLSLSSSQLQFQPLAQTFTQSLTQSYHPKYHNQQEQQSHMHTYSQTHQQQQQTRQQQQFHGDQESHELEQQQHLLLRQQLRQPHQHQQEQPIENNNFNSDSYFSPTDIRRRTIVSAPPLPKTSRNDHHRRNYGMRLTTQRQRPYYYDEYNY